MRSALAICVALALIPGLALARTHAPHRRIVHPRPAPPAPSAPRICAEACLEGYVDQVLNAMMDHDPSRAPLAAGVRYTENGVAKAPGQGLWATATAIAVEGDGLASLGRKSSAYRLYFADPASGQAAYFGAFNENGAPGMMMLRLKAVAGKVTEIETVIVRQKTASAAPDWPGRMPALDPRGFTEPDATLLAGGERWAPQIMAAAASRWFDSLERGPSAGAPTGPDCILTINGARVTVASACAPPVAGDILRVRRRILVVNEDRGLVMAVALVDHGAPPEPAAKTRKTKKRKKHQAPQPPPTVSTDLMGVVFKMSDGRITRIQALERPAPVDMGFGWPP